MGSSQIYRKSLSSNSSFKPRNKSIHPKSLPSNVYLRIFGFASTRQAILVSKVLYTTALPPNSPPVFYEHIHLSKVSTFECPPSLQISYSSTPSSSFKKAYPFIQSLYLRMSTFEPKNKSIHPSLYLRMSTFEYFGLSVLHKQF